MLSEDAKGRPNKPYDFKCDRLELMSNQQFAKESEVVNFLFDFVNRKSYNPNDNGIRSRTASKYFQQEKQTSDWEAVNYATNKNGPKSSPVTMKISKKIKRLGWLS